ncbi:MAG: replicative DNA helicase [Lachnospiraceae bacterium]|jgi:replicative DNA helicase|nr:replicative DNA helicase [Lachnospiraceae bacterium]
MEEVSINKRVMPHNQEAEESVIGSMLMDKDAITAASDIVIADDFYSQQLGLMYETMVELYNEGQPVDPVTTVARLKEKGAPEHITSTEYIMQIINAVPTSANVRYYATIVAELSIERKLIRVTEGIANRCYQGEEPLDDILASTEKDIFNLLQSRATGEFVPVKQVVMNVLKKVEKASQNTGTVTGIATGFIDLDYRTSGLQPSDLVLLAARPSMGKTAFVLNVAQHIAVKEKKTTAIFSLEMSKEQLMNRFLSAESRVDAQTLRNGNLNAEEWERLVEGAGVLGESRLIIDDTPGITVTELRSKCRKYKLEYDLSIVIIDYLQLMSGSGKSESRQQEISDISRSLKALARELQVPVVALSQLSRAVEQRPDHRPMLSDLRESGAIEQDADVVMFLYRDEYYNKDTPDKGMAEVIIAKQRNGPTGTIHLAWIGEHTRFANLEMPRQS